MYTKNNLKNNSKHTTKFDPTDISMKLIREKKTYKNSAKKRKIQKVVISTSERSKKKRR